MLEELQVVTEWNELVKTVDVIHDNLQFEINYLKKTIDHPRSIDIQDLSLWYSIFLTSDSLVAYKKPY